MQLRNITVRDFEESVARVNVKYDGNLHVHNDAHQKGTRKITTTGRLDTLTSRGPGTRVSWSGRHGKYACWHAFRDVVRDLLMHHPDAVIITSLARYTAENFEDTYPATGDKNIGSMMSPAYMPDLCKCEE